MGAGADTTNIGKWVGVDGVGVLEPDADVDEGVVELEDDAINEGAAVNSDVATASVEGCLSRFAATIGAGADTISTDGAAVTGLLSKLAEAGGGAP